MQVPPGLKKGRATLETTRPSQNRSADENVPLATYRLQLTKEFGFSRARAIVPYLAWLGVTHCYLSPILKARPSSSHGYDVTSYEELNPELGGEEGLRSLSAELRSHGIGVVLDIVPNHMSASGDNELWMDVAEFGPYSRSGRFFDIAWTEQGPLKNRVVLPVLLDDYRKLLESRSGVLRLELAPTLDRMLLRVRQDLALPLTPSSYRPVLERGGVLRRRADARVKRPEDAAGPERHLDSLLAAAPAPDGRWSGVTVPGELAGDIRRSFRDVLRDADTRRRVERAISWVNEDPVRLDRLVQDQFYRVEYWRTAAENINYRRFLDVNDLVAVRVDDPEVFEAGHRRFLELIADGTISGLRVDHVDGLMDPTSYLRRLRQRTTSAVSRPGADHAQVYLVTEKILSRSEALPEEWHIDGTTGYDFMNEVNRFQTWSGSVKTLDNTYFGFVGHRETFPQQVYRGKKMVLDGSMRSDLRRVARLVARASISKARARDHRGSPDLEAMTLSALHEMILMFPVYRTYLGPSRPTPTSEERRRIREAVTAAKRRLGARVDKEVWRSILGTLLSDSDDPARIEAVQRLQVLSAAVMVKGYEDTALYNYNRLVSLNEVGGEPDSFRQSLKEFHRANASRRDRWPHSMLSSTTHDTKRSEDVRARIAVISEIAQEWGAALGRWSRMNDRFRSLVSDEPAPSRNDEYLFYQTLFGTWPTHPPLSRGAGNERMDTLVERLVQYMRKASKEEKRQTNWTNPDQAYDDALARFVRGVLTESDDFLDDFSMFHSRVAVLGMLNSLSQVVLKLTCPGVPDIYQGNELWDFSLADPDNRRPVDFVSRGAMLRSLPPAGDDPPPGLVSELMDNWRDGRVKLYVTQRLLRLRRDHPALFTGGRYVPLTVLGPKRENVFAFARTAGDEACIVVVARFFGRLGYLESPSGGSEVWGDTRVRVPLSLVSSLRDVFTGAPPPRPVDGGRALSLASLFSQGMPFAVLA